MVREGEGGEVELHVRGNADVDAARRSTRRVLNDVVRRDEDLVEVPLAAQAVAPIDTDRAVCVRRIRRRHTAGGGEGLGVDRLAETVEVGQAAIV